MVATMERMTRRVFPQGKQRYVCVNREAIVANLAERKTYPTVIVVEEDGKPQEFHAANVNGLLRFDVFTKLPAKVFIETNEEIVCFTDPEAEPTFLKIPKEKLSTKLRNMLLDIPAVACAWSIMTGR